MDELVLSLGPPHHGWLPVHLRLPGRELRVEASNVLNDPLVECIETLEGLSRAPPRGHAVCLWLEPEGYLLALEPAPDTEPAEVVVTLSFHGSTTPPMDEPDLQVLSTSSLRLDGVRSALAVALRRFLELRGEALREHWGRADSRSLCERVARATRS